MDISSTPIVSGESRRLLRNPEDFISPLQKNDDEHERSKRRSNVENLRRKSMLPSGGSPTSSPVTNNTKNLNKDQLLDTINKWNKMYTENKITKQNVWSLHVVEFMRRYLGMQSNNVGNMDMLKFATSALDVSSKVYGLRVDSVYDTSMKLASRINRICAQGEVTLGGSDAEDDNVEAGEANETRSKTKKKPKRRGPKSTVAKDDSELFGNFPQIETGLFNTQTHIRNSTVENLFSSRLPFSKSGTTMKLMNNECAFRRKSDIDPIVCEPLVRKTFAIQLAPKTLPPICPELQKFILDEWDPEQTDLSQRSLEDIVYDKEGFPVAELDASLNAGGDNIEDGGGVYNDSEDEDMDAQVLTNEMARNREVAYVVDFQPNDSNMLHVNEYSYIGNVGNANRQLSQIWAGPSHWKLKVLKRSVARFTGKPDDKKDGKRAKRTKREEEIVTFDEDISDVLLNKQCKNRRKSRFAKNEKLFMPLLKADMIQLDRLLVKFASVTSNFNKQEKQKNLGDAADQDHSGHLDDNVDDGLADYDHNNVNNSQYCPNKSIAGEEVEHTDHCANFLENNLVDKPDMVAQSQLVYQTHAKKIDMRKLKKAIWNCLTDTDKHQEAPLTMAGTCSFKDLMKQVPPQLSSQARGELTCQTVFVALLHLCNEYCLQLDNGENKDIVIRQGFL